jgi:hippurate hydrolase
MPIIDDIAANEAEFIAWRHALHRNPGLGFQETFAAGLVEQKLHSFGIDEVHTGIGGTGLVGVLHGRGRSDRAIGIRADMDALPIEEESGAAHRSLVPGVMHACGHDGHTATLLASAWHLARTRDFAGTINFIFQPAEEGVGGGLAMLADGLFERFPCDRIYAYHNFPGLEQGHFYLREGKMMAGASFFDIEVTGRGGHAAMPHTTVDPIQIVGGILLAAQSIVSRNLSPLDAGILSFTDVRSGTDSYNVIPDRASIKGCLRFFEDAVGQTLKTRLAEIAQGVAAAHGASAEIAFRDVFVPLVNDAEATALARQAATEIAGADKVHEVEPFGGSEDFAYLMQRVPGSYVTVGAGPGAGLHNPRYDFNDRIIVPAASYLCRIAQVELA